MREIKRWIIDKDNHRDSNCFLLTIICHGNKQGQWNTGQTAPAPAGTLAEDEDMAPHIVADKADLFMG